MNLRVKKVAGNTLFQLAGKAVSITCSLLATALITRRFGENGYGLFALMTTFAAYFYLVVDFGINAIVIRAVTENKEKIADYFRNLYTFRFLFSLVIFLVVLCLLPRINFKTSELSLVRWGIAISLFTVISQSLYISANAIFQKISRYDLSNLALTAGNILALLLTLLFLFLGKDLLWMVGATVVGAFLSVAFSFALIRPFVHSLRPSFETKVWKEILLPSLPVGLGLITMVIMAKTDMFLLSTITLPSALGYTNGQALGFYGLAYKVFETALVFPTFFINALYPLLLEDHFSDREKLKNTVKKSALFLFLIGLVAAIVGIIFAPFAITVLGGSRFLPAVAPLQILLLSLPIFFPSALFVWLLVTLGREKYLPLIYAFGSVFNIAGNLYFIPRYGFLASAWLTGITEVIVTVLTAYLSLKILFAKEGSRA
ncbi:MAG: flippase [Patescibacteria group bacterium]